MTQFVFILHKIYLGNSNLIKWSTSLSHTGIKITYLRNIHSFYAALQNDDNYESILEAFNRAGAFYLVNDVIKACEIDDLFRWKTRIHKLPIVTLTFTWYSLLKLRYDSRSRDFFIHWLWYLGFSILWKLILLFISCSMHNLNGICHCTCLHSRSDE